jgi:hypothetical protein
MAAISSRGERRHSLFAPQLPDSALRVASRRRGINLVKRLGESCLAAEFRSIEIGYGSCLCDMDRP